MAAGLLKHNNSEYMKNKILLISLFFSLKIFSQSAFTEESVLWQCRIDTSLKITYRLSNYANIIEINGPLVMDTSSIITGVLKISDGSFEQQKLTPQQQAEQILSKTESQIQNIQQKEIIIKQGFYTVQIFYYNTNKKPFVTFEGDCKNAKTKKLDKDLQLSPQQKKELHEKIEKDKQKPKIKTKTANGGKRG